MALLSRSELWGALALVAALAAPVARADDVVERHLLRGAQHFKGGQYSAALVEFEAARQRGGGSEVARYRGAALVKLERFEEAVEAFAAATGATDDLMTWYEAMACHGARLFSCAERLLTPLAEDGGPTVRALATKVLGEVRALLARDASPATITWYRQRAEAATSAGRPAAARAYLAQAASLLAARGDAGTPALSTRVDAGGTSP